MDKEAIALMAAAYCHLENSILDVWFIIMNKNKLLRQTMHPIRSFFTLIDVFPYNIKCLPKLTLTLGFI